MGDELIVQNINLVNYTIKKFFFLDYCDDYYEIGLIALINASKTYDETKEIKFNTYAVNCIKNEILRYIQSERCEKRKANYDKVSLDEPIYTDQIGNNITLLDVLSNGEDLEKDILKQEKINLLRTIIEILDPQDKFMMEHYFELWGNKKMTQVEIAKKLGLNKRFVCYRIKKVMRIIKKIMEDKYEKEN